VARPSNSATPTPWRGAVGGWSGTQPAAGLRQHGEVQRRPVQVGSGASWQGIPPNNRPTNATAQPTQPPNQRNRPTNATAQPTQPPNQAHGQSPEGAARARPPQTNGPAPHLAAAVVVEEQLGVQEAGQALEEGLQVGVAPLEGDVVDRDLAVAPRR
jgi:hypothetical protein